MNGHPHLSPHSHVQKDGLDIKVEPTFFKTIKGDGTEINGIKFTCRSESI